MLVFRNQHLGAGDIAAFGRRFGTPRMHSLVSYRHADHPEVSWLRNVDEEGNIDWFGVKRATDWHTDSTYEEVLPLLAMLHALEVPSNRGGTMFADMCAAYEALPETMKDRLVQSRRAARPHRRPGRRAALRPDEETRRPTDKKYAEQRRPAVIDHPVTGRADPVRQPDAHPRFRGDGPRARPGT